MFAHIPVYRQQSHEISRCFLLAITLPLLAETEMNTKNGRCRDRKEKGEV
jgi:hypothetical protein